MAATEPDDGSLLVLSYFCEAGHHVVSESDDLWLVCQAVTEIYDDGEKERCGRTLRGPFVEWSDLKYGNWTTFARDTDGNGYYLPKKMMP